MDLFCLMIKEISWCWSQLCVLELRNSIMTLLPQDTVQPCQVLPISFMSITTTRPSIFMPSQQLPHKQERPHKLVGHSLAQESPSIHHRRISRQAPPGIDKIEPADHGGTGHAR